MENSCSKAHSVSFDDALGIVVARVYGKALHSDHMAAREESKCMCKDRECSKLLVDLRDLSTERSSTLDLFSFGRTMAKDLSGLRIAFVVPKDYKSKDDLRFTLNMGENPNYIIAEFASYDVAIDWLKSEI